MSVSVAMASFNGSRYIRQQLDSIATQTMPPNEIVVSDDASSDNTCEQVESFARESAIPVKLIRNLTQLGFADNFLQAAINCSGRHIAFADQDDVWLPQKLELARAALLASGALLFIHQSVIVRDDLTPIGGLLNQGIRGHLIRPLTLDPFGLGYGHTMVFDRSLLSMTSLSSRPFQPGGTGRLAHDQFILHLASLLGSVYVSGEPLTKYRQHNGNVFGAGEPLTVELVSYTLPSEAEYKLRADFYSSLAEFLVLNFIPSDSLIDPGLVRSAIVDLQNRSLRWRMRLNSYADRRLAARAMSYFRGLSFGVRLKSLSRSSLVLSAGKDLLFGVLSLGPRGS